MGTYLISKLKSLEIQEKPFGLLGIYLRESENSVVFNHPRVFLYFMVCTLLSSVSKLCYAIKHFDGIGKFAYNLFYFAASALGITFISAFLFQKHGFSRLIKDIENQNEKVSSSERIDIYLQCRREKITSLILLIFMWGVVFCLFTQPLISGIICLYTKEKVNVSPPMLGSYPYDNENPYYYLISCIVNGGMSFLVINIAAGLNCLFSWYIHFLTVHFSVLCRRFVYLGKCLEMKNRDQEQERKLRQQLIEIFVYHSNLYTLVKRLDRLFAPVLLIVVLFSSSGLCIVIFTLRIADNISEMTPMVAATLGVLSQMVLYCFGGQIIKNQNDMLCQEVYLSIPWHVLNKPTARLLLIAVNRTQSRNYLTCYFFVADWSLFVTILRTASSFGALFRAMEDSE